MTERPTSADERWTIMRRRDWSHDHGSLVAPGAPIPQPDEQLEVFTVVRVDAIEKWLLGYAERHLADGHGSASMVYRKVAEMLMAEFGEPLDNRRGRQ